MTGRLDSFRTLATLCPSAPASERLTVDTSGNRSGPGIRPTIPSSRWESISRGRRCPMIRCTTDSIMTTWRRAGKRRRSVRVGRAAVAGRPETRPREGEAGTPSTTGPARCRGSGRRPRGWRRPCRQRTPDPHRGDRWPPRGHGGAGTGQPGTAPVTGAPPNPSRSQWALQRRSNRWQAGSDGGAIRRTAILRKNRLKPFPDASGSGVLGM